MRVFEKEDGFTLIEVMVALFIFTVGILALNKMQLLSIRENSNANGLTASSNWVAGQLETLMVADYDGFTDSGTGTAGLAGLNANTDLTADGYIDSPDGDFRILWNVAEEEPLKNVKTVRVIVTRNYFGLQRQVSLDYYIAK